MARELKSGRAPSTREHRALWALAYYTGGRPESDLLGLRHRHVELPAAHVVGLDGKPILGWVRFRDAKTPAGNRDVPLHPEAAKAIRCLLLDEPHDQAQRRVWADTPIFRTESKEGEPRPWDRDSYRKQWINAVEAVVEAHPDARGMILRDMRKTFRTRLTNARVPEPTIRALMGHAQDVSGGYHRPSADDLREAILSLPEPPTPPAQVASWVAANAAIDAIV